ncbi:FmdB family transcriptional regulator [Nakamurella antarctica]|uniref:FmdB family transcriptional regulator n=1 Tax=Nakamurella antarctica TaxID=1902245 RepID=A0A3G8ZJD4_9ACTN|nr:FmdB family transcriptional regulator [Nakamurella antarctica]
MPTYQYICTECGHELEAFQAFTDDALTECPICQGKLRKVYGSVGVVFKGSGFYRNDSRTSNSETLNPVKKESAKEGAAAKSEGSTAASTPAPAPATTSTSSSTAAAPGSGKSSGSTSSSSPAK